VDTCDTSFERAGVAFLAGTMGLSLYFCSG